MNPEIQCPGYPPQQFCVGRGNTAALARREAFSRVKTDSNRNVAEKFLGIFRDTGKTRGPVDNDRYSCVLAKSQPGCLRYGSAIGCHRNDQTDLPELGMINQPLRIEHPTLGVDIGETYAIAALSDCRRGRDKSER